MARNESWQGVPFQWYAALREAVFASCSRISYAQFTQCVNKMTAIDTQWNDLFTHTSGYLCARHALPRRLRACVNSSGHFFGTWCRIAARYIYSVLVSLLYFLWMIQHAEYQRHCCCRTEKVSISGCCRAYILNIRGRQQEQQEGYEKEEETTPTRKRKARTVWVRKWLARDMTSDIMIALVAPWSRTQAVDFQGTLGTPWHAASRSVRAKFAQCSRMVHASGTKFMRAKFLNILKFSRRHGTHPRTLHALLTLVYDNFTPCHDSLRAIAGTKIVQVSVVLN